MHLLVEGVLAREVINSAFEFAAVEIEVLLEGFDQLFPRWANIFKLR